MKDFYDWEKKYLKDKPTKTTKYQVQDSTHK